ncbi:2-hydroxychromene-2-carboxylate isomerase [Tepidicaulis sp. LMO-SS28]|uniref:2-hydroxychromene-2-carboxylate isomerase n=1 Tax=Tepidicaulis sp. LMO-SS28 TaxID=3447455 RepID=UPI003EE01A0E
MAKLEFWYEFASTYSYPAAMRVEAAAKKAGVEVIWRPFLLGPIFSEQGLSDSPFNVYEMKGRYMWRDMERLCATYKLPFKRPQVFPQNGLKAARIALAGMKEGWGEDFSRAVYRANFVDGLIISDDAVLSEVLDLVGVEPEEAFAAANAQANKDALRLQTEEALTRGIFGAPSFTVGDELFWGQDRLEQAVAWAKGK